MGKTVLIVGSGAREHAISLAYENSKHVDRIIVSPGNDFIAFNRKKEVLIEKSGNLKNPNSFLDIAQKYAADLVDVAQDDALAAGTVDLLRQNNIRAFGATKNAARIEWDKSWSRDFMQRHQIPMPRHQSFESEEAAKRYATQAYAQNQNALLFVKAGGLAAGKGALKSANFREATQNIEKMKEFGEAGKQFVIEEGLVGEEFSYYAITDGETIHCCPSAQDNKTVYNFDEGDQTGGMGAISPARVTKPIQAEIESQLIQRAVQGMKSEGTPYQGILYLGGISVNGKPFNIEYNARWGDPECQVVLPSIQNDYFELAESVLEKKLRQTKVEQDELVRVCVVGASRGYPNDYSAAKGKRIFGLEEAMGEKGVTVYSAGIRMENGKFYANGGRLFSIVGEGKNILEARRRAYGAISRVSIEGNNLHYRTDIGWRDVERFIQGNR